MVHNTLAEMKGIIPALITPFNEDETLNEAGLRNLVENLIGQKVCGFYLTGSTGEGFLMNSSERKQVVEIVIDQVKGRVPVIVHVGTIDTKTAEDLAKHAYNSGAEAISSVPPFYYKFKFNEIYNYYKDLSQVTPLPLVVYNIPTTTGVDMDSSAIIKLAEIENILGVKYTSYNHYDMQRIKEFDNGRITVFSGADEMCLSGLLMGADSLIGSFYNLIPELFIKIYEQTKKFADIDSAKNNMIKANNIVRVVLKYSGNAAQVGIKSAIKWIGMDCGIPRRPFVRLTEYEMENMKNDLLKIKKSMDVSGVRLFDAL